MPFSDLNTPQRYKDFEERWTWLVAFMVLEDMFVHEILMMMEKRSSKAVPTMGVTVKDSRLFLYYNPNFVSSLTDPELRYVLTHEIYHVALHHCCVRLPERKEDRSLYNIAADLAINCLIPEDSSRHMPKTKDGKAKGKDIGLKPTNEPYNFPDKQSMEQYVLLLREKKDKGEDIGDGEGGGGFDSHDGWDDADAEIVKQEIRNKIEQLSKREHGWGNMPGEVQQIIMAAQKSSVRWWRYLRHYLGNLVSTKIESTFKKPNRRYGYPYCGTKRLHTDRKLVAIDTSGSISDDDLSHFLAELNRLAELQPVDLVMFDHGIQGKVMSFDRKRVSFDFKGRGGTCFTPVFELADQRRYQSLIILTDGCAEAPPKPTHVRDVLWVLTTADCKPPVEWGQRVHMTPKGVDQPTGIPAQQDA
jgi:predicted metal-dependent peptidase